MHLRRFFWLLSIVLFSVGSAFAQRPAVFYGAGGSWADSVMASLSLDQKIGQLFMVAAYSNKNPDHEKFILNLVEKHHIGGLIFMQGGPYRQARLTNLYQSKAKVPLMISMDAEWGLSMRLDSTFAFPWNLTLGAISDTNLIYEIGREMGRQCRRLGVHISFAPVVDINTNPANPIINARSFGEVPANVLAKSRALMRGLQDEKVLACAKHFPGHGDTDTDSHLTLPRVNHSRERLDTVELYPFRHLIADGLGSLMSAHLSVPAIESKPIPTSVSPKALKDLLRDEYGFTGLIFTDALNMKGITKLFPPGTADLNAFLAGNDVLLFAEDVPLAIKMFKKALQDETISMAQIDAAVRRILLAKEWMGLNKPQRVDIRCLHEDLHTPKASLLKRQAYQEALTLVINVNRTLPIQDLEDKKVALVTAGTDVQPYFLRGLKNHQPITHFHLTESNAQDILNKLAGFDKVILGLFTSGASPWKSYKYASYIKSFTGQLGMQNNFVLTVFGNPYGLRDFPQAERASAILLAYQNDIDAAETAAQVIYGARSPKGKLPVSIGKTWPADMGFYFPSNGRLRYGLPEEVGFDSKKLSRIDALVNEAIKEQATPGAQVLVARRGVVVYHKAFGHHTYEKKKPVDLFDLYDIASITKISASVLALMYMTDRGAFDLDASLADYLPELKGTDKANLNIRDVLSHQAGLPAWIPFFLKTMKDGQLNPAIYQSQRTFTHNKQVADNIFIQTCISRQHTKND
jgi:beta-N-acetylhexosaminidase